MTGANLRLEPSNTPSHKLWQWERLPNWTDVRLPVFGILAFYLVLGITALGFNRSPAQILLIVGSACGLDMLFHWLFRGQKLLFPLSAAITGCSLSILTNFAHGMWLPVVPVFFAISSKYLITLQGRHVFNPALFGVVMSLQFAKGAISVSPAYQWGGSVAMAVFVVTAALVLFAFKIKRTALTVSFLVFYAIQLGIRAYLMRDIVPPETLVMGALTSPAFYLFTFFMITDPATSPRTAKGQIWMSLTVVLLDLVGHKYESLSTLFYAGFIYFAGRFVWLVAAQGLREATSVGKALVSGMCRWAAIGLIGGLGFLGYQQFVAAKDVVSPDFELVEIAADSAGIATHPSNILERVDSRIQHIGKWLLSVGDAVAVADVDNDGLQDVFLTYPLKQAGDRAALYRNKGNFQFERIPLPALDELVAHPETEGLPSGALWFDADSDSDADLLVMVGYGKTRLLQNRLTEDGKLDFADISRSAGIDEYTISLTANAFDMNQDGKLDLMIGNAMNPNLRDYPQPTPLNIFHLPQPEYPGDRRMFNFMHRTWHNANNGGVNLFYLNTGNGFQKQDVAALGLEGDRWTLDIGTGDLNGDSFTDLYLANDFGPDQLYLNNIGEKFIPVRGALVGDVSHDTYKGMNASLGDIDSNGELDIYVSNVHEKLQAEGSLLWLNRGDAGTAGAKAFQDSATQRNALNENRFGWGAAIGDLDRDGKLDILQANGMVDDSYDRGSGSGESFKPWAILPAPQFTTQNQQSSCRDYWYWNAQIALTNPDVHGYADRWADLRGRCIFPYELNRVYLNRGKQFIDVAQQVGWTKAGNSRGIALADLDNDGDLDVLVTHQFAPVSIYRNDTAPKSWLGLQLQGNGTSCNRDAIGTKVIVGSETGTQVREVQESNGFSAQGDRRLLFGLGSDVKEATVKIHWCGSSTPKLLQLTPNQYHTITQNG
jgi:Na+-translocating ferredoxin:NAD+ oxidoreductase RnfD subunit